LPDAWQAQYFGSANSPSAAPNATPAGDGVPNWMKYLLGLNPTLPGISVTNGLSVGVVWADGSSLNNPYGGTNTVQIFTAAEVAFNTEVGKTYQIQAASSVSSGWQNVGTPIIGTGTAASYVTPTRNDVQAVLPGIFVLIVARPRAINEYNSVQPNPSAFARRGLCFSVSAPRTLLTPPSNQGVNGGMLALIVNALPASICSLWGNAYV
jgi:hypothetical protein